MAAAMWNHAPHMARATIELKPGELRGVLTYLWTQQLLYTKGSASHGEKVFSSKGCAACHNDASSGAPNLSKFKGSVSAVSMVSVLWRHGPAMLGQMEARRMPWPRLKSEEMADLIAYLNASK
jgi:mono/diheme cytochrome c family protein